MHLPKLISRRAAVKSSLLGLLSVSIPSILFSREIVELPQERRTNEATPHGYPSIQDEIVSEMVGVSHFNLERVKELVSKRPELARACWDWGFGDFETAIGAASHVGRRDIVAYLMENGARPDIFTYAMLGGYAAVKAMIEHTPGIQSIPGPHGITLLQHAKFGLRSETLTAKQKKQSNKLIGYLEKLGDADQRESSIETTEAEKEKYLGDYMYGEGPQDGLSIQLNMRKMLSLGKLGKFGGALFKKGPNTYMYNAAPSVKISFEIVNEKVLSLILEEPDLTIKATKV